MDSENNKYLDLSLNRTGTITLIQLAGLFTGTIMHLIYQDERGAKQHNKPSFCCTEMLRFSNLYNGVDTSRCVHWLRYIRMLAQVI